MNLKSLKTGQFKFNPVFGFFTILNVSLAFGQNPTDTFSNRAFRINSPDTLNQKVYEWLKPLKMIMVGEMHGTQEPSRLLTGLAEMFLQNGDSVLVGFEIPSETMAAYFQNKSPEGILASEFFSTPSMDGRASEAWFEAIKRIGKNPRAGLFFFDANTGEKKRDSTMFVKIKAQILSHPNCKILTISGNVHNIRIPFDGKPRAAAFLANDPQLAIQDLMFTFDHRYESGNMRNHTGNGLELREVKKGNSPFGLNAPFENFLFAFPPGKQNYHDGFLFTKKVIAAEMVKR
jgi:hypothetical protein